jgi:hypothetical protein
MQTDSHSIDNGRSFATYKMFITFDWRILQKIVQSGH